MQTSSEVANPRLSLAPVETRPRRPGKEPMQLDGTEGRRQLDKERRLPKSSVEEKIVINDNYPEQLVTIGGGLSAECRHALIHTLRKNVDIFAWTPADMTGIPRAITEHSLDTYPHIEPKAQKKRSLTPDRRKVVTDEVNEWLKAGATYQRLVDSAFKEQIGVNLEVYVDDMVIKSKTEQDIIKDIEQTFSTLRRINMKLNPKKCSFAMKEGKFLGYVVTSEGIRANPEKAKAIMDMPSPKTLKQMQSLKAAEAAFLEIKKLVSELPTFTTPKKGETLMMYLATTNEVVSAVLLTERNGRQMPIHYVSRSLQGAETNYAPMEKLALALVHAAKRLRRVAIKGQVLTDFLADTPTEISATAEVPNNPRVEDIPEPSNARGDLTPGPKAWRLYTDGASNNEGSGAGLILIAPDDVEYSYALRLNFSNSNNEAEYEALLAGLGIAKEMQVRDIHAFVLELAGAFNRFRITHIPRAENRKADALSKLAAVQFDHLSKEVLVEVLNERSIEAQEVNVVVEEEGPTWMTPIRNYLEEGKLPEYHVDARTLMGKIGNYTIEDGVLYRKSYLVPLMRCVGPLQANYVIREVHMGSCGMHDGPRQVVAKAMNLGYFWPSMHRDARELIRVCDDCQAHAAVPRLPKADMISVTSAWPFMKWGMDIVGPLPEGPGRVKYLIVAIDYFTKWMEAKPLATITGKQVVNFAYDNIVCRFGIPATIVTDNGTQFVNDPFKKWAEKLMIKLICTSVYHPQGNGAVERANKSLLRGIKTKLEKGGLAWAEEVPNVLWAHRTMKNTSNGETPFSLTYGTEVVILAEIGMPTHRTSSVNEKTNDQKLHLNLNLLEERREIAAIREARYKQQVEKYYNKKSVTCAVQGGRVCTEKK
ncbi:reverse transcriptase domain-containing protein [Tanacetum coccineum]